mgnify:CR=1 FL=1
MEMPLVDNGNMKRFHKSFLTYYPRMLMFKEKYGHLRIPGDDPKKEWPGLQQWLKNIRATMSKYDYYFTDYLIRFNEADTCFTALECILL